jgi:hypothetical protein
MVSAVLATLGVSPYLRLIPSFHLHGPLACIAARNGGARTDSELNFCWPAGRGSKGPAAIEGCAVGRPPQRPDHLLPQHLGALNDGGGLVSASSLTFTIHG